MDITNHLERRSDFDQRYVLDIVDKIGNMLAHKCLDFIVFFLSQFCETDSFFSSVSYVFFSRNNSGIYHTVYHTREITSGRVLITPEFCHCLDCSSLRNELFDNTKLEHRDITLREEYLFYKNMDSMTRFHEGFEKLHHLRLCDRRFFLENHNTLLLNSLDIKYYLQEIFSVNISCRAKTISILQTHDSFDTFCRKSIQNDSGDTNSLSSSATLESAFWRLRQLLALPFKANLLSRNPISACRERAYIWYYPAIFSTFWSIFWSSFGVRFLI